jgi:hypothetical protein
VTRFTAGRSVEGRPIEALAFGAGPALLLVHAGIHGDEPGAVALAERFAVWLASASDARVVVVPAANPDGLAAATKDNARGVDLNRNFPARSFGAARSDDARPSPSARYDPGAHALSEPESAALAALIEAERPRRLVAIHQPLRCVNWDGPAERLASAMAAACGWPAVADVGYPTPGSFGARYGVDLRLPVITLELPRPAAPADLEAGLAALFVAADPATVEA